MTKRKAKNVLKGIKLPRGWKSLIEFPEDSWFKWHLKQALAITCNGPKIIYINPIHLKHYGVEGLLRVLRHELGHVGQSANSKAHSRQWYRRALKFNYKLEDDYSFDRLFRISIHKRTWKSFKQWARFRHRHNEFYIPNL